MDIMIPFIVGIFLIFYTEEEEREMPSDLASDWETDEMGTKQIKQKKPINYHWNLFKKLQ